MPFPLPSDPLAAFRRPGFPREADGSGGESLVYEYVGPRSALLRPDTGEIWGTAPWRVESANFDEYQKSGYGVLTVVASVRDGDEVTVGIKSDVGYELEWVAVRRPLFDHPAFNTGGSNPLTLDDHLALGYWQDEPDYDKRRAYKYTDGSGTERTLSTNAQRAARYIARGIESYDDFAPVARRNSTYAGGPPTSAAAGAKTTIWAPFPNKPAGTWEWLKTADRALRASGQRRWQQTEELTGATKVLIDNTTLYLT